MTRPHGTNAAAGCTDVRLALGQLEQLPWETEGGRGLAEAALDYLENALVSMEAQGLLISAPESMYQQDLDFDPMRLARSLSLISCRIPRSFAAVIEHLEDAQRAAAWAYAFETEAVETNQPIDYATYPASYLARMSN